MWRTVQSFISIKEPFPTEKTPACNWGAIKAVNCLIVENQLHGVAIGPRGIGYISGNIIEGNGHEGIWCGGIAKELGMNSKGGSKSVIVDNVISHNGLSHGNSSRF
jgi:hypothetical protein